jgi:4a-hydroxytetrahydrobiopterin dehydratase
LFGSSRRVIVHATSDEGAAVRPQATELNVPTALLSDIAIQRELGSLRGWSRRGDTLTKTYTWRTFPDGIAFVERIAQVAERSQHHPDIDIRYTKVTCTLSTHDAGGITEKDIQLAREIETAAEG